MIEKAPSGKLGRDHVTEPWDIEKSPEAVYGKDGHLKRSFVERFAKDDSGLTQNQKLEIIKHAGSADTRCDGRCQAAINKAKGMLSPGSLPFDQEEITDLRNSR